MNGKLTDILSNLQKDTDQEKLMKYLQGKLSDAEKHEVEADSLSDDFEAEALEGLEMISAKNSMPDTVSSLNAQLQKKLKERNSIRRKKSEPNQSTVFVAIILILIVAVISWVIINKLI